jgi:crotonobetainyl-CoA:carnitine CoA-transferase CaiB-like acyl-CoA transferase
MGKLHMTINRGKRSVAWDLKSEEGRDKLRRLIAMSDVFIHNVRSDAIARLGFDYESVRGFAPDVIYVHCTGFDSDGPEAGLPAYDDIIQGATGVASLESEALGLPEPQYSPLALADKVAGLYALQATLAAIIHKLRTGEGQQVEVPMFESVTAFHLLENFANAVFPDEPDNKAISWPAAAARQPTPTADGYICLAAYTDDRWVRFFEIAGRPEVFEDERFATPRLRQRNREQLYRVVAEITREKTTAEWLELMRKADIPATKMNNLEDMLLDPQPGAVGFFRNRIHPTEGRFIEMRPAVKFSARPGQEVGLPPHIGEHTAEVEAELDYAPERPPARSASKGN